MSIQIPPGWHGVFAILNPTPSSKSQVVALENLQDVLLQINYLSSITERWARVRRTDPPLAIVYLTDALFTLDQTISAVPVGGRVAIFPDLFIDSRES